jgi:hypothetical protein
MESLILYNEGGNNLPADIPDWKNQAGVRISETELQIAERKRTDCFPDQTSVESSIRMLYNQETD